MTISSLYELYLSHPQVTTDSRSCPQGSLFFALRGETFDGNKFADTALENGAAYAIIDNPEYKRDDRYIVVDDALETLRQLAAYHRQQLTIPIVGITGTNGKTTTKELTAAVLSKKFNTLYTQGNLNNHIGVPLTLLKITAEHQMAIIEMGANHMGEIKASVEIVRPDYGIITNVGKGHIEGFGSFENIIKTKGELYDFLRATGGTIFINSANEHLKKIADRLTQHTYAVDTDSAEISGRVVKCNPLVGIEWWQRGAEHHRVDTNLIGSYNLENMLAAICIGNFFGVDEAAISAALSEYLPTNNRSQLSKTDRNRLIVDTYNANPTSMEAALRNFAQIEGLEHKCVLLGDMLELGKVSEKEHQHIVDLIDELQFEKVFLVGKEFIGVAKNHTTFASVEQFIERTRETPLNDCTILIKGSHGIHLEKAIPHL